MKKTIVIKLTLTEIEEMLKEKYHEDFGYVPKGDIEVKFKDLGNSNPDHHILFGYAEMTSVQEEE